MNDTATRPALAAETVIETGRKGYPILASDVLVGAGLELMLASGIQTLRLAIQRAGEPPETIHRFRVALRRLRSLLSAFAAILPREERRALDQRLGSIARGYGPVREWDVFLSSTLRPMLEAIPEEPALLEVGAEARAARQRRLPDLERIGREAAEITDALGDAPWLYRPSDGLEIPWNHNLKDFAGDLLAKRHRRVRKHLKTVNLADPKDFHPLRVEVKKIRYPTEMFRDLFPAKAVDGYIEALIGVQDLLGRLNDAAIARRLTTELPLSSRAQGVVHGWLAREILANRQDFKGAAKRLRNAKPFWQA